MAQYYKKDYLNDNIDEDCYFQITMQKIMT